MRERSLGPTVSDPGRSFGHRLDVRQLLFVDAHAKPGQSFGHTLPFLHSRNSGICVEIRLCS